MGAASHVLLINFIVLLFAGTGVTFAWLRDRSSHALAWTAIGYALLLLGGLSGVATPLLGAPFALRVGLFALTAWGVLALSFGIRLHYDRAVNPALFAWGAVAILVVTVAAIDMPRESQLRFLVLNGSAALALLPGLDAILRRREQGILDRFLVFAAILTGLQFLARGPLAVVMGGTGASPFVFLDQPYALAVFTIQTVISFLGSAALAMVHVRDTVRDLERASEHDPMTGLLNRRGFDAAASDVVERKARSFRPVSVVVTDIDHFKSVNDTHGHDAGDRVICALASLLEATARKGDLVARMGGEEFVVVMVDAAPEMARLYAEAVRTALGEMEHRALGGERVTASFGVAELMPGTNLSEAIASADVALYEAKRAGRDRVRLARPRHGGRWHGVERREGGPVPAAQGGR